MVVLTEIGVDIINTTYVAPLAPLPSANIQNPADRPVYNPSGHKALPPTFDRTERYGSRLNAIASATRDVAEHAHRICDEMEKTAERVANETCLRYERAVDWNKRPKIRRSGMSFRGRGVLEVRSIVVGDVVGVDLKPKSLPQKQQLNVGQNLGVDTKNVSTAKTASARRPSTSLSITDNSDIQFKSPLLSSASSSKVSSVQPSSANSDEKIAERESSIAGSKSELASAPIEEKIIIPTEENVWEDSAPVNSVQLTKEDIYVPPTALRAPIYDIVEEKSTAPVKSKDSLEVDSLNGEKDEDDAWLEAEKKALFSAWGRDTVGESNPWVSKTPEDSPVTPQSANNFQTETQAEGEPSQLTMSKEAEPEAAIGGVESQPQTEDKWEEKLDVQKSESIMAPEEAKEEEEQDAVVLAMMKMSSAAARFDDFEKDSIRTVSTDKLSEASPVSVNVSVDKLSEASPVSAKQSLQQLSAEPSPAFTEPKTETPVLSEPEAPPNLPAEPIVARMESSQNDLAYDTEEHESPTAPLSKHGSMSFKKSMGSLSKLTSKLFHHGKDSHTPKKSPSVSSLHQESSQSPERHTSPLSKYSHDSLSRKRQESEKIVENELSVLPELPKNEDVPEPAPIESKPKKSSSRSIHNVFSKGASSLKSPKSKESLLDAGKSGRSLVSLNDVHHEELDKDDSPNVLQQKTISSYSISTNKTAEKPESVASLAGKTKSRSALSLIIKNDVSAEIATKAQESLSDQTSPESTPSANDNFKSASSAHNLASSEPEPEIIPVAIPLKKKDDIAADIIPANVQESIKKEIEHEIEPIAIPLKKKEEVTEPDVIPVAVSLKKKAEIEQETKQEPIKEDNKPEVKAAESIPVLHDIEPTPIALKKKSPFTSTEKVAEGPTASKSAADLSGKAHQNIASNASKALSTEHLNTEAAMSPKKGPSVSASAENLKLGSATSLQSATKAVPIAKSSPSISALKDATSNQNLEPQPPTPSKEEPKPIEHVPTPQPIESSKPIQPSEAPSPASQDSQQANPQPAATSEPTEASPLFRRKESEAESIQIDIQLSDRKLEVSRDTLATEAASRPKGRVAAFVNAMDMMTLAVKKVSDERRESSTKSPVKENSRVSITTPSSVSPAMPVSSATPKPEAENKPAITSEPPKTTEAPAQPKAAPAPMILATPAEKERARMQAAANAPAPSEAETEQKPAPFKKNASTASMGVGGFFKKKDKNGEPDQKGSGSERPSVVVSSSASTANIDTSPEAVSHDYL
jgi:hypothetical protein